MNRDRGHPRRAAAVLAVGVVAVPVALAEGGTPGQHEGTSRPAVTCARTSFAGRITRVGTDAVAVRPGDSETGRPLVVQAHGRRPLSNRATPSSASRRSTPGQRARFLVRACRSDDRKVLDSARDPPREEGRRPGATGHGDDALGAEAGADSAPTPEPPKPSQETCGQGELNTILVAVSSSSITVRTTSSEGTKEWSVGAHGRHGRSQARPDRPRVHAPGRRSRARRARAVPFGLRPGAEDRRASGLRTGLRGRGGAALRRPVARVAFSRHGGFIAAGRHPMTHAATARARP